MPEVIDIVDPASGSAAQILVTLGFNCFSWRPALDHGSRDVLWAENGFESGDKRPSASGIPLLFPFPGRIGGAAFMFNGRRYELQPTDGLGNAIHGFVYDRPWRVVERTTNCVTGEFQASVDDRSILERWPADFRIRVSYTVRGPALLSGIQFENTGDGPLPCGFGTHAYFRLPLVDGSDPEKTLVHVPASRVWLAHQMLPTGEKAPATSELDLATGGPLNGRRFDSYFTNLEADADGSTRTELIDAATGRRVIQTFDKSFSQCVVYTPPHRQAICLEPYTCLPDTYRLRDAGFETGLQMLQPGESFTTELRLEVR
jgi:aldose 1-epimerase